MTCPSALAAPKSLFCLVGPTAAGKTEAAVKVLEKLAGRVVSADARQVYKFLDIGTNKPSEELRRRVGFEMLDLVSPEQSYSAADYARDAIPVIRNLLAARTPFMLVGGSGLYLRALFAPFFAAPPADPAARASLARLSIAELYRHLQQIDPPTAQRVDAHDRQRIIRALEVFEATGEPLSELQHKAARVSEFAPVYVGLEVPRPLLNERIDARFGCMIGQDLVEEVRHLLKMGYGADTTALDAIGYREIVRYLDGNCSLEEATAAAKKRSRAYAKRQMTWFRHQPGIAWIDAQNPQRAAAEVEQRFKHYLAMSNR